MLDNMFSAGHQIVIKVGGKTVGGARSMTVNTDFGVEAVYGVGSIMPLENVPQRYSGTVELEKFFVRKDIGIGANIDTSSEGILAVQPVDIEVIDKDSSNTILVAQGCTYQSGTLTVTANAFTSERATFSALRIERSEIGKSLLPSGLA